MAERFGRDDRLRSGRDIRTAFREGVRRSGRFCEVIVRPNEVGRSRYGTVVPKYGRTGVERNRVKRRLREIGRREILPGLREDRAVDVLVRAKPGCYQAEFSALRADVSNVFRRALG